MIRRAGSLKACGEQACYLRNGQGDHPGLGRRQLVRRNGRRGLGTGVVARERSGDGADGQGGHDQDGVPEDRGVEADLALVEPEAVLAEREIFFRRPAKPHQPHQA